MADSPKIRIVNTDNDCRTDWEQIKKVLHLEIGVRVHSIVELEEPEMTWTQVIGFIFEHLPDLKDRLSFYFAEDLKKTSTRLVDLLEKHPNGHLSEEIWLNWYMVVMKLDNEPNDPKDFLSTLARPSFSKLYYRMSDSYLPSDELTFDNIDQWKEKSIKGVQDVFESFRQEWNKLYTQLL